MPVSVVECVDNSIVGYAKGLVLKRLEEILVLDSANRPAAASYWKWEEDSVVSQQGTTLNPLHLQLRRLLTPR